MDIKELSTEKIQSDLFVIEQQIKTLQQQFNVGFGEIIRRQQESKTQKPSEEK
jgi:hypothetical protein